MFVLLLCGVLEWFVVRGCCVVYRMYELSVVVLLVFFFFQAKDGIRYAQESRGLGDGYKGQDLLFFLGGGVSPRATGCMNLGSADPLIHI